MIPNTLFLVIPGRAPTKKNSRQAGYDGRITRPSKAYAEYYDFCIGTKRRPGWLCQWGNIQFTGPVRLDCHYWFKNYSAWPDLMGLIQGTADILEAAGLLKNDRQVVCLGTSQIVGLSNDPRVEITITDHKCEWWRDK